MSKNIIEEFKSASNLEKYSALASTFTITGVSLLTILNAIGEMTLIQLAVALIYGGFVIFLIIVLAMFIYVTLDFFSSVMPTFLIVLFSITLGIVLLGVFLYSIYMGIDFIKTFEE